ncbi:MAG: hypothetical protein ACO2PP_07815 [Thermocrinis sp.]|jgi:hypothetical protein|uniref:hypothetical protein n=1 Tax=Thermocrinis sp. TaxID=2024383 RepID=UPI003C03253A
MEDFIIVSGKLALSSPYPTLLYGTGGEEYLPLKKREEKGYLHNLLDKGSFHWSHNWHPADSEGFA